MKTQTLDIQTLDGSCDSYIAYPNDAGVYPAVLFLMDAFGPRPYLYKMAQTLASHGYYVLLPNLFYRTRRAPVIDAKFPVSKEMMPEARGMIKKLIQSYQPELGVKDIGHFIEYLFMQGRVLKGKLGVTGYCMGGGLAIRAAAQYPNQIVAAASFHGGNLASDAQNSPHHLLSKVQAELYIAHADHDSSMPSEQIERLQNALTQAQTRSRVEVYQGASHGFTMEDLPAYHTAALERHWQNLLELFERNLTFSSRVLHPKDIQALGGDECLP